MISAYEPKCVVCGLYCTDSTEDNPKHYHIACAAKAQAVAVVWHGKVLQGGEEHLTWIRDKEEEEGLYLGVAFDDERGFFTATIVLHGVEAEGQGPSAMDALNDAYNDLQQETLRITARVWQLGQDG